MKKFILTHIKAIRIIWISATLFGFYSLNPAKFSILVGIGMLANILIIGTLVFFPKRFIGTLDDRKERTQDAQDSQVTKEQVPTASAKKAQTPEQDEEEIEDAEVFSDKNPEFIGMRDELFEKIFTAGSKKSDAISAAASEYEKEISEAFHLVMEHLLFVVPDHLKEKVFSYFEFSHTGKEAKGKFNIRKFYLERMRSNFGVFIVSELPLNNQEIKELNQAWYPFIHIGLSYRDISVWKPTHVAENQQHAVDDFFRTVREFQQQN